MAVNPIPDGLHSVTPYLIVKGAKEALEFYKKAFGAEEVLCLEMPGGKVAHAEIQVGNSRIMMADEHPEMGAKSPESFGGSPITLMIYVEDVDSFAKQALQTGMEEVRPLTNQFYGDRSGTYKDPYGHVWTFGTHIEDVSNEEIEKRAKELFG